MGSGSKLSPSWSEIKPWHITEPRGNENIRSKMSVGDGKTKLFQTSQKKKNLPFRAGKTLANFENWTLSSL